MRFFIRFLGSIFAFVGLGALADSAVADGICDGVTIHFLQYGTQQSTKAVVSYTESTGGAWYVGWPNSEYSERDYGARTLWYDMDGYTGFSDEYLEAYTGVNSANPLFSDLDSVSGLMYRVPRAIYGPLLDSRLQEYCILPPDMDRICRGYYSDATANGTFCAGCAISDTISGVLFAEVSGLFKDYGCCQYGETGSGMLECPCFFASTLSGVTVTDMNGDNHTAPIIVPLIRTYSFLNCQADAYQRVDSEDGHSSVLPWVSAEDASGTGTGMLIGRMKYVYQPGFWNFPYITNQVYTDDFVSNDCLLPEMTTAKEGHNSCTSTGCHTSAVTSGYWFDTRACDSCRILDDNYSSNSDKMVFKPTVSTAGAFLRSTFGPESCYLEKIGPFEGDNGSYEYSCDSYYKE